MIRAEDLCLRLPELPPKPIIQLVKLKSGAVFTKFMARFIRNLYAHIFPHLVSRALGINAIWKTRRFTVVETVKKLNHFKCRYFQAFLTIQVYAYLAA